MNQKLIDMIKRHEGFRSKPYVCPAGKLSIGYGRNIQDNGITKDEADYLFRNDLSKTLVEVSRHFPWFQHLDPVRQDVVVSMVYNMGLPKFLEFKKTIQSIQKRDFENAAKEMLLSAWAIQVKDRAIELFEMMKDGKYRGDKK